MQRPLDYSTHLLSLALSYPCPITAFKLSNWVDMKFLASYQSKTIAKCRAKCRMRCKSKLKPFSLSPVASVMYYCYGGWISQDGVTDLNGKRQTLTLLCNHRRINDLPSGRLPKASRANPSIIKSFCIV